MPNQKGIQIQEIQPGTWTPESGLWTFRSGGSYGDESSIARATKTTKQTPKPAAQGRQRGESRRPFGNT